MNRKMIAIGKLTILDLKDKLLRTPMSILNVIQQMIYYVSYGIYKASHNVTLDNHNRIYDKGYLDGFKDAKREGELNVKNTGRY